MRTVPRADQPSSAATDDHLVVLTVEDNPHLIELLHAELDGRSIAGQTSRVVSATDLTGALAWLDKEPVDLVLLDLGLPDSDGLDSLLRIVEHAPDVPVVVVTGTQEWGFADKALRVGAPDYLVKGEYRSADLWRTVRHTMARHRFMMERLDLFLQKQAHARDLGRLDEMEDLSLSRAASRSMKRYPMAQTLPIRFDNAVTTYMSILNDAIEESGLEVHHNVSGRSRELATNLGRLRATPRDVVVIHLEAMRRATEEADRERALALIDIARTQLVELMGHLASHYRIQALGDRADRLGSSGPDGQS